jgi:hypothetical protein
MFATKILGWPEQMIIGGVRRGNTSRIEHADAYQSVLMLGTAHEIFVRFMVCAQLCQNSTHFQNRTFEPVGKSNWTHFANITDNWTIERARTVIDRWQRLFTDTVNMHANSTREHTFYPYTGTAIHDIMSQVCACCNAA